jgi:hypothetical protein
MNSAKPSNAEEKAIATKQMAKNFKNLILHMKNCGSQVADLLKQIRADNSHLPSIARHEDFIGMAPPSKKKTNMSKGEKKAKAKAKNLSVPNVLPQPAQ